MQPWKISVGLTAIILALALMMAGLQEEVEAEAQATASAGPASRDYSSPGAAHRAGRSPRMGTHP